jgi:CspA family cold shock protein
MTVVPPFRRARFVVPGRAAAGRPEGGDPTRSRSEKQTMQTGTVKFFNTTKGYGFIQPADGSKDVFVHISAVERSGLGYLTEGQKVNFDVQPDARGPKAVNLQAAE